MKIYEQYPNFVSIGYKFRALYLMTLVLIMFPATLNCSLRMEWYQDIRLAEEVQTLRDSATVSLYRHFVYRVKK
jgi:hypothetical protein